MGNIYFTDGSQFVQKIPAGGGLVVNIGPQFQDLIGVAVDAAGNIYVGDVGATQTITKFSPGGGDAVVIGSGYNGLEGLAVDPSGNVYFRETGPHAVEKSPAAGGVCNNRKVLPLVDPNGRWAISDAARQ